MCSYFIVFKYALHFHIAQRIYLVFIPVSISCLIPVMDFDEMCYGKTS